MNLLLIDTRINDVDKIVDSLLENVDYILFSYETDTYDLLKEKIINLGIETKYEYIGITQINYGNTVFDFLQNHGASTINTVKNVKIEDPNLNTWSAFTKFCEWCIQEKQCKTMDLLACNIWSDPDWVYVIETLRERGIYIRASVDVTGAGGDFILESDGVDMVGVYFTDAILAYKYSFDFHPYYQTWSSGNEELISANGGGTYNYTGYAAFTGTYAGNAYTGSEITTNITGLRNHHVIGTGTSQAVVYHKLDGTIVTGGAYLTGGNASRDATLAPKLTNIKKVVPYGGGFFALKNDGTGILVWGADTATPNASFIEILGFVLVDAIGNANGIMGITDTSMAINITSGFSVPLLNGGFNEYLPGTYFNNDETVLFTQLNQELFAWKIAIPGYYQIALYYSSSSLLTIALPAGNTGSLQMPITNYKNMTSIYQDVYLLPGTYTLTYWAIGQAGRTGQPNFYVNTHGIYANIDGISISTTSNLSISEWTFITNTFTITTEGMKRLYINTVNDSPVYSPVYSAIFVTGIQLQGSVPSYISTKKVIKYVNGQSHFDIITEDNQVIVFNNLTGYVRPAQSLKTVNAISYQYDSTVAKVGTRSYHFVPYLNRYTINAIYTGIGRINAISLNSFILSQSGFSFSFWMLSDMSSGIVNYALTPVFDFGHAILNKSNIDFTYVNGASIGIYNDSGINSGVQLSNITLNDKQWHHVVVSVSPDLTCKYYLDGNAPVISYITQYPSSTERVVNYIGRTNRSVPEYEGNIDEFRFYNGKILTDEESNSLFMYDGTNSLTYELNTDSSLLFYKNAEEQDYPAPIDTYDYKIPGGSFLSTNNHLQLPNITFSRTGATICSWVKFASSFSISTTVRLFNFTIQTHLGGSYYYATVNTSTNVLSLVVGATLSTSNFNFVGQWAHFAFAFNTNNTIGVYINGVLVNTIGCNYPGNVLYSYNFIGDFNPFWNAIGNPSTSTIKYNDFRIYNGKMLSNQEIQDLYNYDGTNFDTFYLNNSPELYMHLPLNSVYDYNKNVAKSLMNSTIENIYPSYNYSNTIIKRSNGLLHNILGRAGYEFIGSNVKIKKCIPYSTTAATTNNLAFLFSDGSGLLIGSGITKGITDFVANMYSYAYIQNGSVVTGGTTTYITGSYAVPAGYSVTDGNVVKLWSANNASFIALKSNRTIVAWGGDVIPSATWKITDIISELTSCINVQNAAHLGYNLSQNNVMYSLGYLTNAGKTVQSIQKTQNKNVDIQCLFVPSLVDYDASFTISPSTITYGVSTTVSYWSNDQNLMAEAYRVYGLYANNTWLSTFIPTNDTFTFTFQNVLLNTDYVSSLSIYDITAIKCKLFSFQTIILQPPGEPVITNIVSGDSQLTIYFDQPMSGGSPISTYKYFINEAENEVSSSIIYSSLIDTLQTTSPITITGLKNGQKYKLILYAVNAYGISYSRAILLNGDFSYTPLVYTTLPYTFWNYSIAGTTSNAISIVSGISNGISPPEGYNTQMVLTHNQTGAGSGTLTLSQNVVFENYGLKKIQFWLANQPFFDSNGSYAQVQCNGIDIGTIQLTNPTTSQINTTLQQPGASVSQYTQYTMFFDTKKILGTTTFTSSIKNIPGLQLWLDAQDSASLNLTDAYLNSWTDTSPYDRNATKWGDYATNAQYNSTALNGFPGIQFTNAGTTNNGLSVPIPNNTFANGISIFVVFSRNATSATSETLVNRTNANIAKPFDMWGTNRYTGNGTQFSTYISKLNMNNKNTMGIYSCIMTPTTLNEYFNGMNTLSTTITNYNDSGSTSFYIASRADKLSGLNGTIGQIIIYDRALNAGQRLSVETYLMNRWGLNNQMVDILPYSQSLPLNQERYVAELKFNLYGSRVGYTNTSSTSNYFLTGISIIDEGYDYVIPQTTIIQPTINNSVVANQSALVSYSVPNGGFGFNKFQYSIDGINYTDINYTDNSYNGITFYNGASITNSDPTININRSVGSSALQLYSTNNPSTTQYATIPSFSLLGAQGVSLSFWVECSCNLPTAVKLSIILNSSFSLNAIPATSYQTLSIGSVGAGTSSLVSNWTYVSDASSYLYLINGITTLTNNIALPTQQALGFATYVSQSLTQNIYLTAGAYTISVSVLGRASFYNALHSVKLQVGENISNSFANFSTTAFTTYQFSFMILTDGNYNLSLLFNNLANTYSLIFIANIGLTYTSQFDMIPILSFNSSPTYTQQQACIQIYLYAGYLYSRINNGITQQDKLIYLNAINDTNWYHIGYTIDYIGTQTTYINGVLQTVYKNISLPQSTYIANYVGRSLISTSNFNGFIDDIRIYKKTMSASEIAYLYMYNNQTIFALNGDASLIMRYKFDQFFDASRNPIAKISGLINGNTSNLKIRGILGGTNMVNVVNANFTNPQVASSSFISGTPTGWTLNASSSVTPSIYGANYTNEFNLGGYPPQYLTWRFTTAGQYIGLYQYCWFDVGTYNVSYYIGGNVSYNAAHTVKLSVDGSGVTANITSPSSWKKITFTTQIATPGLKPVYIYAVTTATATQIMSLTGIFIVKETYTLDSAPVSITPIGECIVPTIVGYPENNSAILSFTQQQTSGSTIAGYKYSLNGGALLDATGTTSPLSIIGLTNGNTYAIQLFVVNNLGYVSKGSNIIYITPYNSLSSVGLAISQIDISTNSAIISIPANQNISGSQNMRYIYSIDGNNTYIGAPIETYTLNGNASTIMYDTQDKMVGVSSINLQGGYISIPNFKSSQTGISISFWMKMTSLYQPTIYSKVFDFGNTLKGANSGFGNISFFCKWNSTAYNYNNNTFAVRLCTSTGFLYTINYTTNAILDVWTHVALVYEPSGVLTTYINGSSLGLQYLPYPESIVRTYNYIGASTSVGESYNYYGKLDDFRIYNGRILSETDINTIYSLQSTLLDTDQTLIRYTFDQIQTNKFSVFPLSSIQATYNFISKLTVDLNAPVLLINPNFDLSSGIINTLNQITTLTEIPGWTINSGSTYDALYISNNSIAAGVSFNTNTMPYKYYLALSKIAAGGAGTCSIYQNAYLTAGTYQFTLFLAITQTATGTINVYIDNVLVGTSAFTGAGGTYYKISPSAFDMLTSSFRQIKIEFITTTSSAGCALLISGIQLILLRTTTSRNVQKIMDYQFESADINAGYLKNYATGNYDASLNGTTLTSTYAKYGTGSLYPSGTTSLILPTFSLTQPYPGDGITISFWIYMTTVSASSILTLAQSSATTCAMNLTYSSGFIFAITNAAAVTTTGTTATTITANTWNHVAITIKYVSTMTNAVMTFYLNGVQKFQNVSFNYPDLITRNTNKINYASNPGYYVDCFKIYKECLTLDEIRDTYYTNVSAFELITTQTKYIISPLVPNAPTLTNLVAGNGELYATIIDSSCVNGTITGHKYSINGGQLIDAFSSTTQIFIPNVSTNIPQNVQVFSYNEYGISPASNTLTKPAYGIDTSISCISYIVNTIDVSFSETISSGYNYNYQYSLSGGLITDLSNIVNDYTTYDGKYYLSTNCIYDMLNAKIGTSSLNIINNNLWTHAKFEPINFSSNGFSIAFWFKSTTLSTIANLFLAQEPYYRSYFAINFNGNTGVITFISNTGQSFTTGATNYNNNIWIHLTFTLTANGVGKFYINGTQVSTYTFTIKVPYGNMPIVLVGSNNYKGNIDDLRIYNGKTLTSTEVLNLAQYTGQSGFSLDTDVTLKRYTFDISLNEFITRTKGSYALANGVYCDSDNIVYGNSSFCFSPTTDTYTAPHIKANYVSIDPTNKNFTFSVWVKANILSSYTNARIFDMYASFQDQNSIRLYCNQTNLFFQIGANGTAGTTLDTGYNINTNTWTHVVGTFSETVFTLYINSNYTYTATFSTDCFTYLVDRNVLLGNSYKQNKTDCFNGNLDDFRFYNGRILSESEINELYYYRGSYTYLNNDPALINWIKSDNTIVNTSQLYLTTDYIPAAGAYISTQDKVYGNACMAIPLGGYVKLPQITLGSSGLTISCWFKLNLNCGANAKLFSLESIITTSSELECIVYSTGTGGNNGVGVAINAASIIDNGIYNKTVLTGNWYHSTITIESNGNVSFYMNGILSKISALQYPSNLNKICNYLAYNNNTGTATFSGFVDDFRIYNRILNATEITSIYNYRGESGFALDTDSLLNYRIKFDTSNTTNLATKYQIVNTTRPLYHNGVVLSKNAVVGNNSLYFSQNTNNSVYTPYIEMPPIFLHPYGLTYTAWVNGYYNTNNLTVFDAATTGGMRSNLIIYLYLSSYLTIVSNGITYTTNYKIANNSWTHIGIIIDSIKSNLYVYINGRLIQTFTNISYVPVYCSKFYIGRSTYMSQSQIEHVLYNGFMDDVRIYNGKSLSASEMSSLYNYRGEPGFSLDTDSTLFYRSNYEQYNYPKQATKRFTELTIGNQYIYNLNAICTENNILQNEGFDVNALVSASTQTITSTTQNVLSSWTITSQFYGRPVSFYTANNSSVTVQPPLPYTHYFAYDNNTYLSSDISALTFNATSPWGTPSIPALNNGVAVSQDGKRAVFCNYGGYIYFSTYTGSSWSELAQIIDNTPRMYQGIVLNSDGTRGVAIVNGGGAYYFTWNGTNYSALTLTNDLINRNYTGLSMTTDGSRIIASVGNDYIYYATWDSDTSNYSTFTQTGETNLRNYISIACSSDGSRIVYTVTAGYTYWADWNGTTYQPGIQFLGTATYTYAALIMSGDKKYVITGTSGTSVYYSVWNGINYVPYTVIPSTVTSGLNKMWGGCYNNATNSFYITSSGVNAFYNITILPSINNSIYQDVYLTPGTYTLSFYSNQRLNYSGSVSVYGRIGTQTNNFTMPQVYYWVNSDLTAVIDTDGMYPVSIGFVNNSNTRSITYITGVTLTKKNVASRSFDFIPYGQPDAPIINSITRNDRQISIDFTKGINDGGSPIIKLRYSFDNGTTFTDIPAETTSPLILTGLTYGQTYNIIMRSSNSIDSINSNMISIIPYTYPNTPIISSIYPSDQQLTVFFNVGFNGGLPLIYLQYSLNNGYSFINIPTTSTSPLIITGLTNEQTYNIIMRSNNTLDSSNSNMISIMPYPIPPMPTIISIVPSNNTLTVNYTLPPTNESIINVKYSLDGGNTFENASTITSPAIITGLTNGTYYNVALRTKNLNIFDSSVSNIINVAPFTYPDAPTLLYAIPKNNSLMLYHTPGIYNGGLPLQKYRYSLDGGNTFTDISVPTSTIVINGLTNGLTYNVILRSNNTIDSFNSNIINVTLPDPSFNYVVNGYFTDDNLANNTYYYITTTANTLISYYGWNIYGSNILLNSGSIGVCTGTSAWNSITFPTPYNEAVYFQLNNTQSSAYIEQSVYLTSGSYTVLFYVKGRNSGTNTYYYDTQNLTVSINNQYATTHDLSKNYWTLSSMDFNILTDDSYNLRFTSNFLSIFSADTALLLTGVNIIKIIPPEPPIITSISSNINRISIYFSPPTSSGTYSISKYKYSLDNGSTFTDISASTVSPINILGLTPGQTYNVVMRANNSFDSYNSNTLSVSLVTYPETIGTDIRFDNIHNLSQTGFSFNETTVSFALNDTTLEFTSTNPEFSQLYTTINPDFSPTLTDCTFDGTLSQITFSQPGYNAATPYTLNYSSDETTWKQITNVKNPV